MIGLLPTYASIGAAAPVLLVVLRLLQGLSAGGEWGGASLLAVEHVPAHKRGLYGNFTQLGTPAGMFIANVVLLAATFALPDEAFREWGWRIPFVASFVMVLIGYYIRRRTEEIREIMLHSSLYCGIPAAVDGIRTAGEIFAEDGVTFGNAS